MAPIPETQAALGGLSRSAIYELIDKGDLVRVKVGHAVSLQHIGANRHAVHRGRYGPAARRRLFGRSPLPRCARLIRPQGDALTILTDRHAVHALVGNHFVPGSY